MVISRLGKAFYVPWSDKAVSTTVKAWKSHKPRRTCCSVSCLPTGPSCVLKQLVWSFTVLKTGVTEPQDLSIGGKGILGPSRYLKKPHRTVMDDKHGTILVFKYAYARPPSTKPLVFVCVFVTCFCCFFVDVFECNSSGKTDVVYCSCWCVSWRC